MLFQHTQWISAIDDKYSLSHCVMSRRKKCLSFLLLLRVLAPSGFLFFSWRCPKCIFIFLQNALTPIAQSWPVTKKETISHLTSQVSVREKKGEIQLGLTIPLLQSARGLFESIGQYYYFFFGMFLSLNKRLLKFSFSHEIVLFILIKSDFQTQVKCRPNMCNYELSLILCGTEQLLVYIRFHFDLVTSDTCQGLE